MALQFTSFSCLPVYTNTFLVWCEQTKSMAVIDPGGDSVEKIAEFLKKNPLKPTMILLTHSHWDHIGGVAELKRRYSIPVYIHSLDKGNLIRPGSDGLSLFFPIEGVEPDVELKEGDLIPLGKEALRVIHTPGHTPGGVCFFDEKGKIIFTGDTLFKGTIGNLSFPTCNAALMWETLKKLALLPPETKVYPGHGDPTTIGDEYWLAQAEHYFKEHL